MASSRSSILAPVVALIAGVALGVIAPLLETTDSSVGHVAHLVLSAGWSWAALAFCVGLAGKSRVKSAVLAPISLVVAVVAYYVTKLERGEFMEPVDLADPSRGTHVYWAGFASKTIFWCVAAVFLGIILGLAGHLARNHGYRGLAFQVLIPLTAVVEMSMRLRSEAQLQGKLTGATWTVTLVLAVAAIVALVARAIVMSGGRRPRVTDGATGR
ncbi:DUF6518 family protein [Streptomyces hokutonensis]|uniref:DUF6518 family protein n=1 Tax=Streptomyces hokutonensis TaxID=1306990 RepID=UPI0003642BD1|nr:DUF6518 family protein [Streptomyces hokutonensis]